MNIQTFSIIALLTFIISLYFHELGHYITAKHFNTKQLEFHYKYGLPDHISFDDPDLNRLQLFLILSVGMIAGALPIICLYLIAGPFFDVVPIVIGVYYVVMGCWFDFKEVVGLMF